MGRNLMYIIPLVVLSLVGGGVQAWSSRQTPSGSGAVAAPPAGPGSPGAPAALARGPEGKPESLWLPPEEVARGLASAAASDVSARERSRAQRWVRVQRERLRKLQERSRSNARALERSQADARLLERTREKDVHLLRRQVALLEAVIQAWEEAAPAGPLRDTLQGSVSRPGPSSWEERARRFTLQGLYRQASEAFCRALSLNPTDPVLHYNLGLLSGEILGEPGRALYHYRLFLSLAPDDPQAPEVRRDLERLERLGEGN